MEVKIRMKTIILLFLYIQFFAIIIYFNICNFYLLHRIVHRSDVSEGWSTLFLGADRSIALRTQRFLYDKYKERPAQVQTYITFESVLY